MNKAELKKKIDEMLHSDEFKGAIEYTLIRGENIRASWYGNQSAETNFTSTLDSLRIQEKLVEHHGGEGEGERYYAIWSFTHGSDAVFVKFDGSYYSYTGADFDSWFFVEPETYTAIRYTKV